MDHNNESSPATSGSQTPTVPVGSGWGQMGPGFNVPWGQLMGMMGSAPRGVQGGNQGGMPWGMPGGGQSAPGFGGAPQMHPQMLQQLMGMMWQGGMQGSPGGDTVYRPSVDFLTGSSHTSTPVETQFTGDDLLSLHDMGIDLGDPDTPVPARRAAPKKKTRGKAKAVGESSQPAFDDTPTRRKWTEDEYAGVARGWLEVCEDPLVANNQRVVNMWAKIRAAYRRHCPHGKDFSGEEIRKGWERIRAAVGRFSSLHVNAVRQLTSGQNEEDARRIAESQFPVAGKYKDFTFWECFLLLKDSEKFRAGCEAGWPKKQRLNYSGDYSGSSGGSHDLPPDAEEFPSPPSFAGRPRPVGQKRAQRAARGGSPLSPHEVQSSALPPAPLEYTLHSRNHTRDQMYKVLQDWRTATDPTEKMFLKEMLDSMRVDLAIARARLAGSDVGSDTTGGGSGGDDGGDGDEE